MTHHTLTGAPFGWDQTNALNIQVFLPYYPTYLMAHVVGDVAAFNLIDSRRLRAVRRLDVRSRSLPRGQPIGRVVGCARLHPLSVACRSCRARFAAASRGASAPAACARRRSEATVLAAVRVVALAISACWLTSGYFGAMAVISTVAFAVGAALTSRAQGRGPESSFGGALAALVPSGLLALAAVVSGTNAGRWPAARRGRSLVLRATPASSWSSRLRGSLALRRRVDVVLGTAQPRLEPDRDQRLSRPAHACTGDLLARHRAAPARKPLRCASASATVGLVAAFVVGFLFASAEPDPPVWARRLGPVAPPLRGRAGLPRAVSLGSAADDGARPARGARAPAALRGTPRFAGTHLAIGRRCRRDGRVLRRACRSTPRSAASAPCRTPPEYAAVERTPPGILAEYPLGYSDIYRLWQTRHGRPLLNGAPADTPADAARRALLDPTEPGTAEDLSLLGVSAIAIHPGAHVDAEVPPREPEASNGYQLVGRFARRVVGLAGGRDSPHRPSSPSRAASPARSGHRRASSAIALISSAGVGVLELSARSPGIVRLVFDARRPERQTAHAAARRRPTRDHLHRGRRDPRLGARRSSARPIATAR